MSAGRRIRRLTVVTLLIALVTAGCVGYVGDGYGDAVVTGPDEVFWAGPYERGHEVYGYSHRGAVSRGFGHGGGGFHGGGGGHGGGGHGGGGGHH